MTVTVPKIVKVKQRVYLLEGLSLGRAGAQIYHVATEWDLVHEPHTGTVIIHRATEEQMAFIEATLIAQEEPFVKFHESDLGDALTAIATKVEFDLPLYGTSRKK